MYKISDKMINFITNAMKKRRVKLTAGGQALAEVKIKRLTLATAIRYMQLNFVVRKCMGGYKLKRSQDYINHLMYVNKIKVFVKMKNSGRL